ncbi:hypothetical protein WA026_016933 [Henosepilachna vigintioctopunctata]|uniref:RING-type E3 ubiquitin transferase n=1 Tax=Henosepilachna vigintioctopunctata TaxID=420089 RepID=A0AAW1UD50_9CUCU
MENTSTLIILNPNEENKEYRCDVCYKYLSIAPILFSDKIGSVCGRCYNDEDLDVRSAEENSIFHVQKAYENIAVYIIFPCIYHSLGCDKQLRWNEVQDHEEICEYKSNICPLSYPEFNAKNEYKLENICEWKGMNRDLIHHIRNSHSNCIANSNELAILSSDQDLRNDNFNKILFFEVNGIFTIAVLYYFKDFECYYCNVLIDSSFKECELFYYDLEIFDITKKRCLVLPGNKVEPLLGRNLIIRNKIGLELDLKIIKQLMKKSDNIKLSFNVVNVLKVKTKVLIKEANEGLHNETPIISDLKCNCGNYLYFPVNVCTNGHNCCHICKRNYGLCQICKTGFIQRTNTNLENITKLTKYGCKNKARGCSYTLDYNILENHENNCNFTLKSCLMQCEWKGTNEEMFKHIQDNHCTLQLKKENSFYHTSESKSYPIFYDNKIFIFTIEYKMQHPLFISMQCLGIEKWEYEFDFRILNGTSISFLSTHICQPFFYESDDKLAPPRRIEFPFNFVSQFLTRFDEIKFKVNISKVYNPILVDKEYETAF